MPPAPASTATPAGMSAPRAAATNASGTASRKANRPSLYAAGRVLAAGQEEEEFGGAAAAVEDGRLGVAGLELRIVAGGDAAGREGAGAERAVVEVEWMASREYRAVIGDRGPGRSGPKSASASPACATTSAATATSQIG